MPTKPIDETENETEPADHVCPLCEGPLDLTGECEDTTCEACPDYKDDEEDEDEDLEEEEDL